MTKIITVPPLPSQASLKQYDQRPPDILSEFSTYIASDEAQELVWGALQEPDEEKKYDLICKALKVFPFSVEAYLALATLFRVCSKQHKNLNKTNEAYQHAVTCAQWVYPEMASAETVEWGVMNNRPYLRALHGMGLLLAELGRTADAIEHYSRILKLNPSDNQGIRYLLFNALLELGEFTKAEEIVKVHSQGRDATEADFCYGFVVIDYLRSKLESESVSNADLEATLSKALQTNNAIPHVLLMEGEGPPDFPGAFSPGSKNEAISYAIGAAKVWKNTPGLLTWLRKMQDGSMLKPNDDGTILFNLLQQYKLIVVLKSRPYDPLECHTMVHLVPGQAMPSFSLPPGMKDHDPSKIVCWSTQAFDNLHGEFTSFSYDDVYAVHFWEMLASAQVDQKHHCNACYEPATKICSRCKAVWYCSVECQKKDWKGLKQRRGHKGICPKLKKT